MKQRIKATAASLGCVVLLSVWGGLGCESSGGQARSGHECEVLTGAPSANFGDVFAMQQSWVAIRGSVVSPLGDAPGEKDLEVMSGWALEP